MSMEAETMRAPAHGQADVSKSESVRAAEGQLGRRAVSAAAFAAALLKLHPEYADGRGEILLEPLAADGRRRARDKGARTAKKWLEEIRVLIDPDKRPMLDGRLVLLGLALLDDRVFQKLHGCRALDPLVSEIVGASKRHRPRSESAAA